MSGIQNVNSVSKNPTEIRFKDLDAKNQAKIIGIRVAAVATALIFGAAVATAIWLGAPAIVGAISLFALKIAGVIAGGATIAAISGTLTKKLGQWEDQIRQDDAAAKAGRFIAHLKQEPSIN